MVPWKAQQGQEEKVSNDYRVMEAAVEGRGCPPFALRDGCYLHPLPPPCSLPWGLTSGAMAPVWIWSMRSPGRNSREGEEGGQDISSSAPTLQGHES